MLDYTPHDWYWVVAGDESKAWSSKSASYVSEYPKDGFTRITSEEELREVLTNAGIPSKAPNYVPQSVYMWQAKAALAAIGKLDLANQIITGSNSPQLQQAWEYAPFISRKSPAVVSIGQALQLTEAQVDDLFRQAEGFKV